MADILDQMASDAGGEKASSDILKQMAIDAATPVAKPINAVQATSQGIGQQLLRQFGLTARHGIEGVGDTLDMLASPIRAGMNAILPSRSPSMSDLVTGNDQSKPAISGRTGQSISDLIGLPSPQNSTERIAGDVVRLMAGGALPIGVASKVSEVATGVPKAISGLLSSNPVQQIASAGSAGFAGGATREAGGGDVAQLGAALAAGVATPMVMSATLGAGQKIGNLATNLYNGITRQTPQTVQIDLTINNALKDSGLTLDQLPMNVRNGMREDVGKALATGGSLSPDAVRRLADYRMTGTTPTNATLTLDPALISQQKNLAKLGINSKDETAQLLGRVENTNNNQLISGLNAAGASTADDAVAGGQKIISALNARNDTAKSLIGQRYDAARATSGRSAALDHVDFVKQANNALDESLLGGKLPTDVRGLLNKVSTGEMPLTVDTAEQFKTRIGDLQRASSDASERKALGLVRQSLDNTSLIDGQGQAAVDAFNKARGLNRAWMNIVEKTPALQAVRDGIEPDKFVQQFVIGNGGNANVMDVAALKSSIKNNPEAMQAVKDQITAALKKSALNGASDEVGKFSQSAYNKALSNIGDRKLGLFFSPEEVGQLKAIGRVASYEQFQPAGSAVNNSNTAGTGLAAILDRIGNSPLLSKIPLGKSLADPINNISIGMQAKQLLNPQKALIGIPQMPRDSGGLLLSPAAFLPTSRDKKEGLLSP